MTLKKRSSKVQKFHTQYLTKEKREKSQTAAPGEWLEASSTFRSFARIKAELIAFGSGLLDSKIFTHQALTNKVYSEYIKVANIGRQLDSSRGTIAPCQRFRPR